MEILFATDPSYAILIVRVVLGVIFFAPISPQISPQAIPDSTRGVSADSRQEQS